MYTSVKDCTIFIHVDRVRSGRFGLGTGVNLPRPQLTRVVHHLSLFVLGLRTTHSGGGESIYIRQQWMNNYNTIEIYICVYICKLYTDVCLCCSTHTSGCVVDGLGAVTAH